MFTPLLGLDVPVLTPALADSICLLDALLTFCVLFLRLVDAAAATSAGCALVSCIGGGAGGFGGGGGGVD